MDIESARSTIKDDWKVSPYYEIAEHYNYFFWDKTSPFAVQFAKLDCRSLLELACGHGRHTDQIINRVGDVTLVDINEENIEACRKRFGERAGVTYLVNSGSDLSAVADGSKTAVFCYDAMVHFEIDDVIAYLKEIYRVLAPGGRALLHYSNYDKAPGNSYHDNPHWRNFNSERLFKHLAIRWGFSILNSEVMNWGFDAEMVTDLDALTLIEKPA
jgi:ubiquinone/menaquinone biosynthesis C-methylase UbiE